jgi:hypothetical protein
MRRSTSMKAREFDKRFDEGQDISKYLDMTKARRAGATMTTKNVTEFLQNFSVEDLKEAGILRGISNQLKGTSIDPLIALMREHGVDRLEYPDRK